MLLKGKFYNPLQIEHKTQKLLKRYREYLGEEIKPPIDIEAIAEQLLNLNLLWSQIEDSEDSLILAQLEPTHKRIRYNDSAQDFYEKTNGLYRVVTAHELGHFDLHVDTALLNDKQTSITEKTNFSCLKRTFEGNTDWDEKNAHRYAGCLLIPKELIIPEVKKIDVTDWKSLYGLRDLFGVTMQTLIIRLTDLNLIYVTEDKKLFKNKESYGGQLDLGL